MDNFKGINFQILNFRLYSFLKSSEKSQGVCGVPPVLPPYIIPWKALLFTKERHALTHLLKSFILNEFW